MARVNSRSDALPSDDTRARAAAPTCMLRAMVCLHFTVVVLFICRMRLRKSPMADRAVNSEETLSSGQRTPLEYLSSCRRSAFFTSRKAVAVCYVQTFLPCRLLA